MLALTVLPVLYGAFGWLYLLSAVVLGGLLFWGVWRVLRAANALRTEGLSLTRAAEAVGYQSDVVFAKAFKRVTGESPGRYRRGETPSLSVRVPRTA